MKIKVLLFGMLAEKAGTSIVKLEEIQNTADLLRQLEADFPSIKGMQYNISVNQEIYKGTVELQDGDEVALLPPFAGG